MSSLTTATAVHTSDSRVAMSRSHFSTTDVHYSVTGFVTDDAGHRLRHALLRLTGTQRKEIFSDAAGQYEFTGLPNGRYSISATRSGFVSMQYGQRHAFDPPESFTLDREHPHATLSIALPTGGVITGQVLDEAGIPMPNVVIRLSRPAFRADGHLTPTSLPDMAARSDDLGRYRVAGVPPGDYFVSAATAEAFVQSSTINSRLLGYVETYSPAASTFLHAARIHVASHQESSALIKMVVRPLVQIGGVVKDSRGKIVRSGVVRYIQIGSTSPAKVTAIQPDGTFRAAVFAGSGAIKLTASNANNSSQSAAITPEFAELSLDVENGDIDSVELETQPGAALAGRVVVDGAQPLLGFPPIRVFAEPIGTESIGVGNISVPLGSDGMFLLQNAHGRIRIATDLGPDADLALKAVHLGGTDITDDGIDVKPGKTRIEGLEVLLTRRVTRLSGVVHTDGADANDVMVVLYSDDERKIQKRPEKYLALARLSPDGTFSIGPVPSGGYFAVALALGPRDSIADPHFRRENEAMASHVRVADGEQKTLDLYYSSDRNR